MEVTRIYFKWASQNLSKEEKGAIVREYEEHFFGPNNWESGCPTHACEWRGLPDIMHIDICAHNLEKNLALLNIKEALGLIFYYKFHSQHCESAQEARETFD